MLFRTKSKSLGTDLDRADDETSCLFVGSKGIMKLCEVHKALPNDAAKRWPRRLLRAHRPGGRIYVHVSELGDFVRRALPRIAAPFVLVSGDVITEVSPKALGAEVFDAVVNHPHLIGWHAQNLGVTHPKIAPLPLGMDYHTISRRRRPEWGPAASPRAQEDLLHTIRALGPDLAERQALGYSNWHFVLDNGDRAEVINLLPKSATFYEPKPTPRTESWIRSHNYFFTISPTGRGMDCHRTWEAILLGCVPVIPDLPINRLFQSLPVVIVKDWRSVTPDFLAAEKERILGETFDFAPVLLETWRRQIFGISDTPVLRMRFQEFLRLGAKDLAAAADPR